MEALDILEKRIDSLSRMLGPLPEKQICLTESLISTQSLMNGALEGREKIHKTMERSEELDKYLEPNYIEENQQVRAKEVYLNAVAQDLHTQFEQLQQIKQLEPTLGAEYFRSIPAECTDKLKKISEENAEYSQQSEMIEESLILAMKHFGEIQTSLMNSLSAMNKRLDSIEEKLEQKKREQLEKEIPSKE